MSKKSVITILAENLRALMAATPALSSSPKVASKGGVSARTINNAEKARHDPKLSSVEAIARRFGLETYQLLIPSEDKDFFDLCRAWNQSNEVGRELMLGAAETALRISHAATKRDPGALEN